MADENDSILAIDKDRLDVEWLNQPLNFYKFSKRLAKKRALADEAKGNLDLVEAEVDKDIRANPRKYGFGKDDRVTESAISAAKKESEEYQAALKQLNEAKYEVDLAFAMVTAMSHKKDALENLVRLHGQDYFASPRGEGDAARMAKEGKRDRADKRTRKEET